MNWSLQARLSLWLSGAIVAVALVAGGLSFGTAFEEANEIQDHLLVEISAVVRAGDAGSLSASASGHPSDSDADTRIAIWPLSEASDNAVIGHKDEKDDRLKAISRNGLFTTEVNDESWRVFISTDARGRRFAVGQRTAVRLDIARSSAWRTLVPLALLMPILLGLVALLVVRMFRPLKEATDGLKRRSDDDLTAIEPGSLPKEIRPFVLAINGLLARIALAMATQRRFVADAAHELRSPMTALSLQAEQVAEADTLDKSRERLTVMRTGLIRARLLLDQLLGLARAQMTEAPITQSAPLRPQLFAVLEDLMPLAQAKDIDLGVIDASDVSIRANPGDVRMMLRNLIENSIRFTPHGGQIDVVVEGDDASVSVHVDDTGPGISESERERVFDAFYRIVGSSEAGSGLGLSIVRTLAIRNGARVELSDCRLPGQQSGLRASITFSKTNAPPSAKT